MLRRAHRKAPHTSWYRVMAQRLRGKFCSLASSTSLSLVLTGRRPVPHCWLLVPVTKVVMASALSSLSSSSRLKRALALPPQKVPLLKWRPKQIQADGLRFAMAGESGPLGCSKEPPPPSLPPPKNAVVLAWGLLSLCFLHVLFVSKLPQPVSITEVTTQMSPPNVLHT